MKRNNHIKLTIDKDYNENIITREELIRKLDIAMEGFCNPIVVSLDNFFLDYSNQGYNYIYSVRTNPILWLLGFSQKTKYIPTYTKIEKYENRLIKLRRYDIFVIRGYKLTEKKDV